MGPRDHNRLHWVARYGSVHVVPWTRLGKYLTFSLPLLAARTSRSARAVIRSAAITPNERLPFCPARACRVIPRSFRLLVHRSEAHRMSSATATPPIRSVAALFGFWRSREFNHRVHWCGLATLLPFYWFCTPSSFPHPCLFQSRLRFCSVCYWSAPASSMQYVGWEPAVAARSRHRGLSSFRIFILIPDRLEFF
jgi:hypothetical protein